MSATHTPGPWVALYQPVRDAEIATVSWVGEWCVGVMTPGFPGGNYRDTEWGDTAADARLIAAAPDLLEALELARNGLLWFVDMQPQNRSGADDEGMAQIDAAIAKATGAQP